MSRFWAEVALGFGAPTKSYQALKSLHADTGFAFGAQVTICPSSYELSNHGQKR